jgi:hypothetical protein
MIRTVTRWYPALLLRDALGRFMKLRVPGPRRPRPRVRRVSVINSAQLVLF